MYYALVQPPPLCIPGSLLLSECERARACARERARVCVGACVRHSNDSWHIARYVVVVVVVEAAFVCSFYKRKKSGNKEGVSSLSLAAGGLAASREAWLAQTNPPKFDQTLVGAPA